MQSQLILLTCECAAATIREMGAFGMPQKDATVLCDTAELKVSVCNNLEYLMVQAIVWNDNDEKAGMSLDGKKIGDYSVVLLDVDADGKETAHVDKQYHLNPWPESPGLHFVDVLGEGSTTGLNKGSKGRGSIRYVQMNDKKVRIDTYLIPRPEISGAGDKIRLAVYVYSPHPKIVLSSTGYNPGKDFYGFAIPLKEYHWFTFRKGGSINPKDIPDQKREE
jgi:hypothetical protein